MTTGIPSLQSSVMSQTFSLISFSSLLCVNPNPRSVYTKITRVSCDRQCRQRQATTQGLEPSPGGDSSPIIHKLAKFTFFCHDVEAEVRNPVTTIDDSEGAPGRVKTSIFNDRCGGVGNKVKKRQITGAYHKPSHLYWFACRVVRSLP